MKISKKLISVILSITIAFLILPISAFSENDPLTVFEVNGISAIAVKTLIKDVNGNITSDWIGDGQSPEYFKYCVDDYLEYTVTYDEDKTFTGKTNEFYNKFGSVPNLSDNQSYENEWDIGKHTITVNFMGKSCDAEVEIVKNPVDSISAIAVKTLIKDINGWTTSDSTGEGQSPEYFKYRAESALEYTVTYDGGNTFTGNQYEIQQKFGTNDGFGYLNAITDQSYENQWDIGKHSVTVNFMGKSCEAEVEIVKNPVDSISAIAVKTLIKDINGNMESDCTGEGQSPQYLKYRAEGVLEYTIIYDGGKTFIGDEYQIEQKFGTNDGFGYLNAITDQSYENQWGVGKHIVTVNFMGKSCEAEVEVVKNPVENISAVAVKTLIKDINGWTTSDCTGEGQSPEYFKYYVEDALEYTVTYDGGNTFTGNQYQIQRKFGTNDRFVYLNVKTDQSYENQWNIGKHSVTVNFMGKSCDAEVEIVKNPIESISAVAVKTLIKDINGNMESDCTGEGQSPQYLKYRAEGVLEYTVTYDGGNTFTGNQNEIQQKFGTNDGFGYLNAITDQSYENQWDIGKHSVTVNFMGKSCEAEVEIVKNSIESISAVAVKTLIKDANGNMEPDWIYADQSHEYLKYYVEDALEYTITYDEGKTFTGNRYEIQQEFCTNDGYGYLNVTTDQSYDNQWDVGKHTVTVNFMGKSCEAEVEIVKNPIESVSAIAVKTLIKDVNGNMGSDCTGEGQSPKYFKYYVEDALEYTVTYDGGNTFTGNQNEIQQKFGNNDGYVYLNVKTDQSYENQWNIGKHSVTVNFMGKSCEAEVEIVKNPIESISAVAIKTLIKDVNGWTTSDWTGDGQSPQYLKYSVEDALEYTITYSGNKTFTGNRYEIQEKFGTNDEYGYLNAITDQSYENQWDVGKHTVTVNFMGKSCEAEVEIVKNPIESISAIAVKTLIKDIDGYTTSDWTGDGESPEYFKYDINDCLEYTVTYDEGKTFTGTINEFYNKFGNSPNVRDDQRYDNQWDVGKHAVTVNFMGKSCEAEIDIQDNTYTSISISGENEMYITFQKKDGTTILAKVISFDERGGGAGAASGLLTTDKGVFNVTFTYSCDEDNYEINYGCDVQLNIGNLKSNVLSKNNWLRVMEMSRDVATYYNAFIIDSVRNLKVENGSITNENINNVISLSFYISSKMWAPNKGTLTKGTHTYLLFEKDFVKQIVNQFFNIDDIDFSNAMIDPETGYVMVEDASIGGEIDINSFKYINKTNGWLVIALNYNSNDKIAILWDGNAKLQTIKTLSSDINKQDQVNSISITPPIKRKYLECVDSIDLSGCVLTIIYNNGNVETVDVSSDMLTGFDNTKVGKQALTVTYNNVTTTFEIEIVARVSSDMPISYRIENGGAIIKCTDAEFKGKFIIPQIINGYVVIGIDNMAFENISGLTSLVIPNSVKSIGNSAFLNCNCLNEIDYYGTKLQYNLINIAEGNGVLKDVKFKYNCMYDSNNDGICDVRDLVHLEKILAQYNTGDDFDKNQDFNLDGYLSALDLILIKKVILAIV